MSNLRFSFPRSLAQKVRKRISGSQATLKIYFVLKTKPTTGGKFTLPFTKIAEFAILKATESLCLIHIFHNVKEDNS